MAAAARPNTRKTRGNCRLGTSTIGNYFVTLRYATIAHNKPSQLSFVAMITLVHDQRFCSVIMASLSCFCILRKSLNTWFFFTSIKLLVP
jgi:hypothetical protein